jgi:hypothetical protein
MINVEDQNQELTINNIVVQDGIENTFSKAQKSSGVHQSFHTKLRVVS